MSGRERYRAIRRIGRGGMAETFECILERESGERERVCVKRILPAYRGDAEIRRLFREEGRLALDLEHPNIIRALSSFEDEEGPGLAFEMIDGVNLRELIDHRRARGGALPIAAVIHLMRSIARGLDYAHRRRSPIVPGGLIHRDITPSNLLVDLSGELKIGDFGIARALDEARRDREPIRGKLPYLAPEYAIGAEDDERSDLFSLGIVAYELLALTRPYPHESVYSRVRAQKRARLDMIAEPPAPSATIERGDVPPRLLQLIDSLLAIDPAERPMSAHAALGALDELGAIGKKTRPSLARLVERCQEWRERADQEAEAGALEETESLREESTVRLDIRAS